MDVTLKDRMMKEIIDSTVSDASSSSASSNVNAFHALIEVSDEFADALSDVTSPGSVDSNVDDYTFGLNYLFKEQDVISGLKCCSLSEFEALKTELMKLSRNHRVLFLKHTKALSAQKKEEMMNEIDDWIAADEAMQEEFN